MLNGHAIGVLVSPSSERQRNEWLVGLMNIPVFQKDNITTPLQDGVLRARNTLNKFAFDSHRDV